MRVDGPRTAPPNNGMHPTANYGECHRELGRTDVVLAAGDAGRYADQVLASSQFRLKANALELSAAPAVGRDQASRVV